MPSSVAVARLVVHAPPSPAAAGPAPPGGAHPLHLLADSGGDCLARNTWICGEYLRSRQSDLVDAVTQHVTLTLAAVGLGLVVAVPLALLARRVRWLSGPVFGLTAIIYTIPSLAMFSFLLPVFGLAASLVVTALALYSLTILVRGVADGLAGVPADVREAARGMGYGGPRMLATVDLPLALPAIMAAIRVATVSTVGLVTVGGLVGYGGLGNLILDGFNTGFHAQILAASVLSVLVAVAFDLVLLAIQWLLTPWLHTRWVGRRAR